MPEEQEPRPNRPIRLNRLGTEHIIWQPPREGRVNTDYFIEEFVAPERQTGAAITQPIATRGIEPYADAYALNDETGVGDWRLADLPKKKKDTNKVVEIDKATLAVIQEITEEIINDSLNKLLDIYKNRLDFIEARDYNSLVESVVGQQDRYLGQIAPEAYSYRNFENSLVSLNELVSGKPIANYGYQGEYLAKLEEKAKQRYSIEHSKYRYYPRLKGTVKYGNPELLAKILAVTQIGKGKIVCK